MAGWSSEEFSLLLSSFCFAFPPLARKICLQVICEILLLLAKAEADLAVGPLENTRAAEIGVVLQLFWNYPPCSEKGIDMQNKNSGVWAVSGPRNLVNCLQNKLC